jgi:hypothetical protein
VAEVAAKPQLQRLGAVSVARSCFVPCVSSVSMTRRVISIHHGPEFLGATSKGDWTCERGFTVVLFS